MYSRRDQSRLANYLAARRDEKQKVRGTPTTQQVCKTLDNHANVSPSKKTTGVMSKKRKASLDNEEARLSRDVADFLSQHLPDDGNTGSVTLNRKVKKTKSEVEAESRSAALASKARQQLNGSMFRSLNEYLYTESSFVARKKFTADQFQLYHEAYRKVAEQWPQEPIDFLIQVLQNWIKPKQLPTTVIADVGCGTRARVAEAFSTCTVHSFDLHAAPDSGIIAADMCRLPLDSSQCHFAVYSLSLMPTNLKDAIAEANRILRIGGYLLIVEPVSRFENYKAPSGGGGEQKFPGQWFAADLKRSYGLQLVRHELLKPNDYFIYLSFKKSKNIEESSRAKLPPLNLKACVYKSRSGKEG